MIPEIGHFALIVALLVALVQGVLPMIGAARRDAALMAVAVPAARAQLRSRSAAWRTASSPATSPSKTSRCIPIRSCRRTIASPRRGARTKAHCCCGR